MKNNCSYIGNREHDLVAYLYGEMEPFEQTAFESHLAVCLSCRDDLAGLRAVRVELGQWAPPEPARGAPRTDWQGSRTWWREVPRWAQVAAALLFLGVAAGIANLDVRYDRDGLTVRTGWMSSQPPASTLQSPAPDAQPWRSDFAALERQLRNEFRTASATNVQSVETPKPAPAIDAKQTRALIAESERRQQRELALRIAEVLRDMQAERQSDLVKIQHSFGTLQNSTGVEVMRQRQLLNSLAVRVSQRQ